MLVLPLPQLRRPDCWTCPRDAREGGVDYCQKNYPHSSPKAQCDNTHMLEFLIAKKSPGVQGLNGGIMP